MPSRPATVSRFTVDHAANSGGMALADLERFLDDVRHQPQWRVEADREDDYYDGNQLDSKTLADLEERGIPPIILNLIAPTIDIVLGLEARTRKNWVVKPDKPGRAEEEVAEALTIRLKEAERMSRADRANSEAFAAQVKSGIGWVEVGRPIDPFEYRYRCRAIHRRDIWWDWRAREMDLSDARYLIRRKWFDKDYVLKILPQFKDIIEHQVSGTGFQDWIYIQKQLDSLLARDSIATRDSSIDELEWRDAERNRLGLFEIWYKQYTRGYVFRLPDGSVIEFDRNNQRHKMLAASGAVKLQIAVFPKIRLSWWIGPHRLMDIPNPYPFDSFPYVPFIAKRESRTGVPYGMIRPMIPPQDEVNARRSKMLWQLSARRVEADEDAVFNNDHNAVMNEISRPDAYIKLNPDRRNQAGFRVYDDQSLTAQQFQVYEDAKNMLQDTVGVYAAQLGKGATGQSGVAIASLVEQGTQGIGDILDNYNDARQRVGNMLLALIKEDMAEENDIEVIIGDKTHKRRKIVLNGTQPQTKRRTNDVVMTGTQVVLDDAPSTATFKAQQQQAFGEIIKSLPPELQAILIDVYIEMGDYPNKAEAVDRIRKATGQESITDPEEMTEEERQVFEQQQQAKQRQAQLADQMQQLEIAEKQAKIAEIYDKIDTMRERLRLDAQKLEQERQKNTEDNEVKLKLKELEMGIQRRRVALEELERTMAAFTGRKANGE